MILYLGILTIFIYCLLALIHGLRLFGQVKPSLGFFVLSALVVISLHGWILYQLIDTPLGQNLNWLIMLSFTTWLMNILLLLVALRSRVESLSVLTYPLSALCLGLALCWASSEVKDTHHPYILTHIFISFSAMSFLILASFQGLLMGLQNYLLKHHRPSAALRILPPLQTMENLLFVIVGIGIIFLSGSLISGFLFEPRLLSLPKIILATCAWGLFTLLLAGRYFFGWRGLTALRWTLCGSLFIFLSYFGTKALL